MKYLLIIFISITFSNTFAQLSKNTLLISGIGSIKNSKNIIETNGSSSIVNEFQVDSRIGNFFANRLVTGVALRYLYFKSLQLPINVKSKYTDFGIGLFVRNYFLDNEKRVNIFLDLSYSNSLNKLKTPEKQRSNILSVKSGISVFFNENIAIEVAGSYQFRDNKGSNSYSQTKDLSFDIGFQIHLPNHKIKRY